MTGVLEIEVPSKGALFNEGKIRTQEIGDNPEPGGTEKDTEGGASKGLGEGVVAQIDTGADGEESEAPGEGMDEEVGRAIPEGQAPGGQEGEVGGEEEHVLAVGGGPAVGVADLEEVTGVGA
ncbi:Phosphatidic acid phosphatase-related / PAP2-related [Arachis hypogaea]|nr:Phosphatidic acid phosphatase-related / PAP2-related [Arachis hypogaea]